MPIIVTCSCGKRLRAKDELAGRRVRCPGCAQVLVVPVPAPSADASQDRLPESPGAAAPPTPDPAPAAVPPRPGSSLRDYLYAILLLALIPLGLSVFQPDEPLDKDTILRRINETVQDSPPDAAKHVEEIAEARGTTIEDVLDALPEGKLKGALLPHRTWTHWFYAAMSAAAFFALMLVVFPRGTAAPGGLLAVGLFTGTAGIFLLLALQFVALRTSGIILKGNPIIMLIFYIIKFIGFSYRAALDPKNGFLLSFVGFTCGVGLCEELCKSIPIAWHYRQKATLDWRGACLWGLATGVGFGVSEGITYASDYYNGICPAGIYVVRFVSCVALHAVWSAGVGIMLYRGQMMFQGTMAWWELLLNLVKLQIPAMVLHGLYDTLLKKDMEGWALLVALAGFGWLAWQIEYMRRGEAAEAAAAGG